jgi:branched-chain amino acid transport system permease protein
VGRPGPRATLFGFDLVSPGPLFTSDQKRYLMVLVLLVILGVLARNLARSDVGRAFAAVRDRDIAAEVIGVNLAQAKAQAFTVSSFYAGVCGALLYTITPVIEPASFNLLLSVQFVAMVLIGGVATITGSIMGALFIALLPRLTQELPRLLPFISAQATGGGLLTSSQVESILYGVLIVVFLIFEPRGLFGVWLRARNYWKGWPFSY